MNEKEKWLAGENFENENLSPDEEVIHEQNKTIERLQEQLESDELALTESEEIIAELKHQIDEANDVLVGLITPQTPSLEPVVEYL